MTIVTINQIAFASGTLIMFFLLWAANTAIERLGPVGSFIVGVIGGVVGLTFFATQFFDWRVICGG